MKRGTKRRTYNVFRIKISEAFETKEIWLYNTKIPKLLLKKKGVSEGY